MISDQLRDRRTKKDELLDVGDFFLLFMVRLHLIDLVLLLRLDIRRIITVIIHKFLLGRKIHDVGANRIHKILRMGGDDEDVIICG